MSSRFDYRTRNGKTQKSVLSWSVKIKYLSMNAIEPMITSHLGSSSANRRQSIEPMVRISRCSDPGLALAL